MYHITEKIQIKAKFYRLRYSGGSKWVTKIVTIHRNNERILRAIDSLAMDRFHLKTFT